MARVKLPVRCQGARVIFASLLLSNVRWRNPGCFCQILLCSAKSPGGPCRARERISRDKPGFGRNNMELSEQNCFRPAVPGEHPTSLRPEVCYSTPQLDLALRLWCFLFATLSADIITEASNFRDNSAEWKLNRPCRWRISNTDS